MSFDERYKSKLELANGRAQLTSNYRLDWPKSAYLFGGGEDFSQSQEGHWREGVSASNSIGSQIAGRCNAAGASLCVRSELSAATQFRDRKPFSLQNARY